MTWRFRWWRTWDDIWGQECQAIWRELFENDPHANAFQRPELVRAWADTVGQAVAARPQFGLGTHASGARALLPAVAVEYRGRLTTRRVLEPAGQALFGYHDPIAAGPTLDASAWSEFWAAVRQDNAQHCDQALFHFVSPRCGRGPRSRPCSDSSPVLELAGVLNLDALLERCSANHRGDVRRRLRRLGEKGAVALWVPDAGEVDAALRDLRNGFGPAFEGLWGAEPARNLLARPGIAAFLDALVAQGIPAGWAHYAVLRIDGEPIAWHLGLVERNALYWWFPTHARRWEALSPGKVLLAKLLEHGMAQGWTRVHLLTGGQPYKMAWKPDVPELRTVRWHSPTPRGKLLAVYDFRRKQA